MGLSKLAAKCRVCPFVDKCDNKRMEAHGYLEIPNIATPSIETSAESMAGPILRETMTIMIDGEPHVAYVDDIKKQLYRHLYSRLGFQYGG